MAKKKICYKVVDPYTFPQGWDDEPLREKDNGKFFYSCFIEKWDLSTRYKIGERAHAKVSGTPIFAFKTLDGVRAYVSQSSVFQGYYAILECEYSCEFNKVSELVMIRASYVNDIFENIVRQFWDGDSNDDVALIKSTMLDKPPMDTILVKSLVPIRIMEVGDVWEKDML